MSTKYKNSNGFTIVELLIVVIIIAILAVIVIVAYNGVTNRTYSTRAKTEISSIAKAIQAYETVNGEYPADVGRGIPAAITPYINGSSTNWPDAPWPHSIYDYDNFIGDDGNIAIQMSVRFCPTSGQLSDCTFPNEPWTAGFQVDSSAYWCVTGKCKSHPSQLASYPGYCLNCTTP